MQMIHALSVGQGEEIAKNCSDGYYKSFPGFHR